MSNSQEEKEKKKRETEKRDEPQHTFENNRVNTKIGHYFCLNCTVFIGKWCL
jgi:hypothetical protein